MIRVLIIGSFDGAIGGVSVHINRLLELLKKSKVVRLDGINDGRGRSLRFPNIRNFEFAKIYKSLCRNDIIHINCSTWWLIIIYILIGKVFRKKIIVTLHSFGYLPYQKKTVLFFLKVCDRIVTVNNLIKEELDFNRNVIVQYAFLPPNINDDFPLPQKILTDLIENRKLGKKIIIGNAGKLFLHKSEDLYGLDLCIACARKFKSTNAPYYIIFIVSYSNPIAEDYLEIIKKDNLENYILLHVGLVSFPNLIKVSDLVVRPTNKDGDAITVRESIYYNKPVLASDVVKRPKGVNLFKNRNSEDFYQQIKEVLNSEDSSVQFNYESIDFKDKYEQIYRSVSLE